MHRLALILLAVLTSCPSRNRPPEPNAHVFIVEKEMAPFEGEAVGLELFTPTGFIRVFEAPRLRVRIKYQISASGAQRAKDVADACRPMWKQEGKTAKLLIGPPKDYPMERLGIGLEVYVPRGWDLDLGTRSGLLDTSAYQSRNQKLRSLSGDLRIGESSGLLTFQCDQGSVEIKGAFRRVRGRCEQGNLRIVKTSKASQLEFQTKKGNVQVHLRPGVSLRIGLRTLEGSVHTNVALTRQTKRMPDGWKIESLKIGEGPEHCRLDLIIEKGSLLLGMN
jgi:hypothetical protein